MLSTDLLAYFRRISAESFTVVDVETTGHQSQNDRITEISVLQATLDEGITAQQTDLVNPQREVPPHIVRVTGITQAMVDAAPPAATVLPPYLPMLQSGILTAHNLEFDYSFLRAEFAPLDIPFNRPETQQLCTVQLARLMLPDLPSRSLPNLVKHFQFPVGESHRAAADAIACWLLAERLLTEILNEDDDLLLKRFAQQWISLKAAATLLRCPPAAAKLRLETAGVTGRPVGRGESATTMYRRGAVERIVEPIASAVQLSIFDA